MFCAVFTSWAISAEAKSPLKPLTPGAPVEEQLKEHGDYTNAKGETVHAPAHSLLGAAPDGATAKCRDGEFSFSHSRSGTCSGHGGVGSWLR
ncbi:DUF3761 domain-containing protein (plasmid) [Methylocystis parvus]|uniref:DUF3761 domain-containing protein n=2 Tax=Methylocystis parvus TaxID=134 RepID=A0A6B8MFP3_9HYPH|nr:DUF3761 domain-containing protein [Methylocystis parvus]QGN00004.1 DUF3761 domain-containing protein [Methylocystis parvus]